MLGTATVTSLPGSRSSRLRQPPRSSLGEQIDVEASVGTDPPLPPRLLLDECGVTPGAVPRLGYKDIAGKG